MDSILLNLQVRMGEIDQVNKKIFRFSRGGPATSGGPKGVDGGVARGDREIAWDATGGTSRPRQECERLATKRF
jgi:hypothetical protein